MQHAITYYFLTFFTCFILVSCNPFGIQGPEPAFLNIDEISIVHDFAEGPRNHRIDHVEIFFENFSIGFYELPVELALIPTQEISNLTIFPAIQLNGQVTEIVEYEMMTSYTVDQAFEIGETYTITPEFDYKESSIFDYVETFESGNSLNYDADEIDSTITVRSTDEAANGIYSCLVSTEKNGDIYTATNFLFTGLINNNQNVFVEFNYKSNGPIEMGFIGEGNALALPIPFITLNPQSEWRKMYLDLTPLIIEVPAPGYRLYFRASGGTGENATEAYFDNIKILHQE